MTPCRPEAKSPVKRRQALKLCFAILAAPAFHVSASAQAIAARRPDVPYEPTPQPVVDRMLELAHVNSGDLVYDLGCGDGRIVITAAKQYGARGVGIDIDPQRILDAQANARAAGMENKVQFQAGDLFTSDFSDATVVTLFLWPHINRKLRPLLWRQLRVGTRVVSYIWDMGEEWPSDRSADVGGKKIYCWTIKDEHKRMSPHGA
jgi:predicted RNA methylase